MVSIIGYHTCKKNGGWSVIDARAPFLSGNGHGQWLTQGYYFWTDSDHYAKRWGDRNKKYGGSYAIVKCKIEIDDDDFFDLVGSVKHQLYFRKELARHRERLKRAGRDPEDLTVSDTLRFLRAMQAKNDGYFPFVAIKAQDDPEGKTCFYITGDNEERERMPTLTRQQICLFELGHEYIVEKEIVYPDSNDEDFYQGYENQG